MEGETPHKQFPMKSITCHRFPAFVSNCVLTFSFRTVHCSWWLFTFSTDCGVMKDLVYTDWWCPGNGKLIKYRNRYNELGVFFNNPSGVLYLQIWEYGTLTGPFTIFQQFFLQNAATKTQHTELATHKEKPIGHLKVKHLGLDTGRGQRRTGKWDWLGKGVILYKADPLLRVVSQQSHVCSSKVQVLFNKKKKKPHLYIYLYIYIYI